MTNRRLGWIWLVSTIAIFAVIDAAIGPLMATFRPRAPAVAVIFAGIGTIFAQMELHAIWCVFGPASLTKRVGVALGAGMLLWLAWGIGWVAYEVMERPYRSYALAARDCIAVQCCLPIVAIACQTPLWLARFWLSWQIVHEADCSPRSKLNVFGIRHILAATGLVAAALALARLPLLMIETSQDTSPDEFLWPQILAAVVMAAATLATALPAMAIVLRMRQPWLAIIVSLSIFAFVSGGLLAYAWIVTGNQPDRHDLMAFISVSGGFCVALLLPLFVTRRLGYRLVWGRPREHARSR